MSDEPGPRQRVPQAERSAHDRYSPGRLQRGFEQALVKARLAVIIAVMFLLVDAAATFVYGTAILLITVVTTGGHLIDTPAAIDAILGKFLIVMDAYLVGATLMITAIGFYELFVIDAERAGGFWLPRWLQMRDLEDLKARVVSMLILVAAISFVDFAIESHNETAVLYLGAGVAIVIISLTAFLRYGRGTHAPAIRDNGAAERVTRDPE